MALPLEGVIIVLFVLIVLLNMLLELFTRKRTALLPFL